MMSNAGVHMSACESPYTTSRWAPWGSPSVQMGAFDSPIEGVQPSSMSPPQSLGARCSVGTRSVGTTLMRGAAATARCTAAGLAGGTGGVRPVAPSASTSVDSRPRVTSAAAAPRATLRRDGRRVCRIGFSTAA